MDDALRTTDEALNGLAENASPADLFQLAGRIQDQCGGVPMSALAALAKASGIPEARIWGALTAYPQIRILEGK